MEDYLEIVIGVLCIVVIFCGFVSFGYYLEYKKSTGGKALTFTYIIALLVFMTILPLVLLLLLLFAIYCQIINLILKIRFRSKYGGILEGTDAIHTVEGKSKNVGNILFIVRYKSNDHQHFYDTIKKAILKKFSENAIKTPKLWFTLQYFLGYSYYLKNQVTAEECIKKLEKLDVEEIDKADCVKLVSRYSNTPLPKHHTAMWEVLIGTQPVKWRRKGPDDTQKYYPVVLRIHHCLSDAASFVKVFVRLFGDVKNLDVTAPPGNIHLHRSSTRSSAKVNEKITIKLPTTKEVNISSKPFGYLWNTLRLTVKSIYVLIMVPPILLVQTVIKARDNNILHGVSLSGEKNFALGSEERSHYVQGIKHIKNRIPGTAYPDILFAAISASFSEYFRKTSGSVPDSIAGLVPLFPPPSQLPHFIPENPDVKKIVCRNIFSMAVLNLPLSTTILETSENDEDAISRLASVKKQIDILKQAIDYEVNYVVLMLFIGILPYTLRKPFLKVLHCTFIITIVPAPSAMTVLGGYEVEDVMFWVPNIGPMGIGFSVLSYDKRLQIGLIADKALIPEEKDAQDIIDGIKKYLDLLNLETDFSRV